MARLKERPVEGTPYALLGTDDDPRELDLGQRIEMASRLIEVGPKLPKYAPPWAAQTQPTEGEEIVGTQAKKEGNGAGISPELQARMDAVAGGEEIAKRVAAEKEAKEKEKAEAKAAKQRERDDAKAAKQRARDDKAAAKAGREVVAVEQPSFPAKQADRRGGKPAAKKAAKKKTEKPAKTAKKAKAKGKASPTSSGAGRGIGAFCCELLVKKKSTEEVIEAVKKKFPGAKTSPASIAWYRARLREEGKLPKD